jgi:redox-sensitive bicupin YhaK (pirin superfamily)
MFPLVDRDKPNPLELFQIWLNLPKSDKLVEPYFTMLWDHTVPRYEAAGVLVTVVAGALDGITPPAPPPNSWASRTDAHVAIWTIKLAPGARWTLPAAPGTNRGLYFFRGAQLRAADQRFEEHVGLRLKPEDAIALHNEGPDDVELLLLQGKPINEPVVQYGPFVMNTPQEIQQAFLDYRRTQFGGWPWDSDAPVHAPTEGRFAKHADGKIERVE